MGKICCYGQILDARGCAVDMHHHTRECLNDERAAAGAFDLICPVKSIFDSRFIIQHTAAQAAAFPALHTALGLPVRLLLTVQGGLHSPHLLFQV
jgi:hypothetical protein